MSEAHTHGNLSVVVPMDDMKLILQQIWKSRKMEPRMNIGDLRMTNGIYGNHC